MAQASIFGGFDIAEIDAEIFRTRAHGGGSQTFFPPSPSGEGAGGWEVSDGVALASPTPSATVSLPPLP